MANIINQNIDNNYNDNNSNKIIFEKSISNKHILKDAKNKDDIFKVKKKFQTLLENENAKKYFNAPSKSSQIFNCILESDIKSIINNEYHNEKNIKIEEILRNSENEINITQNVQANFEAYSEKIEALKGIYSNIKKCNAKIKNDWTTSKSLDEFIKRFDKIDKLYENEYQSSKTDSNYIFFSSCLDFIIKKLVTKAKEKIDEVEKEAKNLKNLYQSIEEIISFLNNLKENLSKLDIVSEPIIDTEKLNEFVNKEMEYQDSKKVDLKSGKI